MATDTTRFFWGITSTIDKTQRDRALSEKIDAIEATGHEFEVNRESRKPDATDNVVKSPEEMVMVQVYEQLPIENCIKPENPTNSTVEGTAAIPTEQFSLGD